jgi:hypothetical protein
MKDTHRRIAAMCRTPQTMDAIVDHVGCTKSLIYNLIARGMLVNHGNKRRAYLQTADGVMVEPERVFEAPAQVVQASSVWHYARRCAMEARA